MCLVIIDSHTPACTECKKSLYYGSKKDNLPQSQPQPQPQPQFQPQGLQGPQGPQGQQGQQIIQESQVQTGKETVQTISQGKTKAMMVEGKEKMMEGKPKARGRKKKVEEEEIDDWEESEEEEDYYYFSRKRKAESNSAKREKVIVLSNSNSNSNSNSYPLSISQPLTNENSHSHSSEQKVVIVSKEKEKEKEKKKEKTTVQYESQVQFNSSISTQEHRDQINASPSLRMLIQRNTLYSPSYFAKGELQEGWYFLLDARWISQWRKWLQSTQSEESESLYQNVNTMQFAEQCIHGEMVIPGNILHFTSKESPLPWVLLLFSIILQIGYAIETKGRNNQRRGIKGVARTSSKQLDNGLFLLGNNWSSILSWYLSTLPKTRSTTTILYIFIK